MLEIKLNLNSDLMISSDKIRINIDSSKSDNAIQIKTSTNKGLFVDKSLVTSGNGFVNQIGSMMRIGYVSGYDKSTSYSDSGRVTANNVVHRVFTSVDGNWVDFRVGIDCFKPGDMFRVPRSESTCEYFLITETSTGDSDDGYLRNKIENYISLGTFSWCGSDTGRDEFRQLGGV